LKSHKLLFLAGLLLVVTPMLSSAGVITFEGFPDGTSFTTQNFGAGVTFAGATVLTLGGSLNSSFPPHSGVNVVYNISGPMTLSFSSPVDYFSGYFTYNAQVVISAYDATSGLLTSATSACNANYVGSGSGCAANEFMIVNAVGAISSVVIAGGGGNNFTLDDAGFPGAIDAGAVPEPGTMSMLAGGLVGLAMLVRRRRKYGVR
jgi:hypothetical protein